jgi:alpha-L-fucosidase
MFVHWGAYAQLGRGEWVMNRERIPQSDYERLAATWRPKPGAAREWAALAKRAGMKYMVMTAKHHDGFLLWDSRMTAYNAARLGPRRDLVREYVEAAREFGLRVGLYYSLLDWHHPDGAACATDPGARRRFLDYTQGCVRELMSRYGRIDVLWYDGPWPFATAELWESARMNAMVRALQPGILINDRSKLPEDFSTPEGHIRPAEPGRSWEACMTLNGSWGWQPAPESDWLSARRVIGMLREVTAAGGNLLLNIGPRADGSVPEEAIRTLRDVGRWLRSHGGAVYGSPDRTQNMEWVSTGNWTRRGNAFYFWCSLWPGRELAIGGLTAKLTRVRLFPRGKPLPFDQSNDRLVIRGLPRACPDRVAGVALLELTFGGVPRQRLGVSCRPVGPWPRIAAGRWASPFVTDWRVSRFVPRQGGVSEAPGVRLRDALDWQPVKGNPPDGFVNVQGRNGNGGTDGILYLANRFLVAEAGTWTVLLGHDGGAAFFVDGRAVYREPARENPARPGRAAFDVSLAAGSHELVVAFDLHRGNGWGIFVQFEVPRGCRRRRRGAPVFPRAAGHEAAGST